MSIFLFTHQKPRNCRAWWAHLKHRESDNSGASQGLLVRTQCEKGPGYGWRMGTYRGRTTLFWDKCPCSGCWSGTVQWRYRNEVKKQPWAPQGDQGHQSPLKFSKPLPEPLLSRRTDSAWELICIGSKKHISRVRKIVYEMVPSEHLETQHQGTPAAWTPY